MLNNAVQWIQVLPTRDEYVFTLPGSRSVNANAVVLAVSEVVLCLLLSKFTFAKSEKEITWNLAGIRFPTAGDTGTASLPMKVALYRPN